MQHGATLKNCHITIIENARYLPFGSVFNLHVFIYDPVDSSLSQRPLQLHKAVHGSSALTFTSSSAAFVNFTSTLEELLTALWCFRKVHK